MGIVIDWLGCTPEAAIIEYSTGCILFLGWFFTMKLLGLTMTQKIASEVITVKKEFEVIIERDEDGIYVASVPELNEGCHTQAKSMNELRDRISEAVVLYLGTMSDRLKVFVEYKKE